LAVVVQIPLVFRLSMSAQCVVAKYAPTQFYFLFTYLTDNHPV
jgi:hypothetical protein